MMNLNRFIYKLFSIVFELESLMSYLKLFKGYTKKIFKCEFVIMKCFILNKNKKYCCKIAYIYMFNKVACRYEIIFTRSIRVLFPIIQFGISIVATNH